MTKRLLVLVDDRAGALEVLEIAEALAAADLDAVVLLVERELAVSLDALESAPDWDTTVRRQAEVAQWRALADLMKRPQERVRDLRAALEKRRART